MTLELPAELSHLLRQVPALRRSYLVGGCVRDALLGRPVKDFDIEVFGTDYEQLARVLQPFGKVDFVGRSFGVVKLTLSGAIHDFSVPRRESKSRPGHRGFVNEFDPTITPREAASRRDFTINALMYDVRTPELLDFFGGEDDLRQGVLRHTSAAFVEDPLRVLRGMQFAGRFALKVAPETVKLCQGIVDSYPQLATERVREEWFKWASSSTLPSRGIHFLNDTGWIGHFPELAGIRAIPQEPDWHPEGDVFVHTCHSLDALARQPEWRAADVPTRITCTLAVLAHDFGKAVCTEVVERAGQSRIVSPGHEHESHRLAGDFLERIGAPNAIVERVLPLVANHMAHFHEVTERTVRRLARRLHPETVEHLCLVMTADSFGRPPRAPEVPRTVTRLRHVADELRVADASPARLLLGRHLLAIGMKPGPEIGRWTEAAFEAQLDGEFRELAGGYAWLAEQPGVPNPARDAASSESKRLLARGA